MTIKNKVLVKNKHKNMLPTELENLVGYFAWGPGRYNLNEELEFVSANRGMVPDAFLEYCVVSNGFKMRMVRGMGFYMLKNPLRTDNPFTPWALVDPQAQVFSNTFLWWLMQIRPKTYKRLHTYRATFRNYVFRLVNRGRDFFHEWNLFMSRYLGGVVLADPASYVTACHEGLFRVVCEQVANAGFMTPKSSLPKRPSRRSVLLRASGPPA